jgi:hypothetical protein
VVELKTQSDDDFSHQTIGSLALGVGVITDISIATALCYYLQKLRTELSRQFPNRFMVTGNLSDLSYILDPMP